ncbi:MAG TPA: hypothetical protein VJR89_15070, partial [Polyangiales bacterium]|nr:hypothetical protein [Polyangiales bacterium]
MRTFVSLFCLLLCLGLVACGSDDAASESFAPQNASRTSAKGDFGEAAPVTTGVGTSTPSFGPAPMAPSASPGASAAGGFAASSGAPPSGVPATPVTPPPASGAPLPSADAPASSASTPTTTPAKPAQAGTLTAGTWDDNRNFDRFRDYRSAQQRSGAQGILPLSDKEHEEAHQAFATPHGARQKLDVALVIDTTGSMTDEISYLQTEFLELSHAIEADYPDAEQRWSLIVYRDNGDEYVTRTVDF